MVPLYVEARAMHMPSKVHTRHRYRYKAILAAVLAAALSVGASGAQSDTLVDSGFFTSSDHVRLHYLEAGRGATLVFVPGWTMPARIWMPQIRYFAPRFHVVALDPRAQGESQVAESGYDSERRARDIKELLDALHLDAVVLVGWSLGVLESLTYVRLFGTDRLNALVLVDNSVGEEPPPAFDPTFLERLQRDRQATTEQFVRGMYHSAQSEDYYQRIIDQALKTPTNAAVKLLHSPYPRQMWREILYGVDKPALYVVTARFKEQALNLKRSRPGVQVAVFEDAGHALFVDEAERFNRLLEAFIDKIAHRRAPATSAR
jgi:non-heme chloroperoxidase